MKRDQLSVANTSERVRSVDGLRAVAIAMVVGIHAFAAPKDGQLGVDLFFVLSGFLITAILLREHDRMGRVSLRAFYGRRARRLLPALSVLLVVFCIVAAVRREQVGLAAFSSLAGLGFSMNVIRAWDLHSVSNGISHLWSLAAEDQFYLVWPPVMFILAKGRRRAAAIVLLLTLAAMTYQENRLFHGAASIRLEFGPDTRAIGLPIGCLIAILYASRAREQLLRVAFWTFPLALFLFALLAVAPTPPRIFAGLDTVFCICCAGILLRALVPSSHTAKLLSLAPFAWLGRISYSLYLWHLPILVWLGWQSVGGIRASAGVAIALVIATASYYFVEQPVLRRGRARRAWIAENPRVLGRRRRGSEGQRRAYASGDTA